MLISFDIVSLYTNIPHDFGIEAISYWLDRYPEIIHDRFDKEFIVKGLELILKNNNFSFNSLFFNKCKGTAMGTKVAPTYATLVLGYLEEKLYVKIASEKGGDFAEYIQKQWKRYLDDCFMFWERSLSDLIFFENILNSLHTDIIFKIQQSSDQMPFLDIMVIKNGTKIVTDIYFKSTDSKQYLTFKSCHPKHTKANVPFSLARRVCTIVSDRNVLKSRLIELYDILIKRDYPIQIIKTGIVKALQIPRSNLLNGKEYTEENLIPFISTHNPKNRELFGVLKSNFEMLQTDVTMKGILNNTKFIKCKRQLPNLRSLLIKSEFNETNIVPSVSKCNEPRCALCKYIIEGSSLKIKNKVFHIRENMNCTVKNVIYVLICNGCSEFYIGQTGDKLRNRRTVHDQQIRDPSTRQLPLSAHIEICSTKDPKYLIFPFYKCHSDNVSARLSKERYFINIFNPKLNNNCNN